MSIERISYTRQLRATFESGITKPYKFRIGQLQALYSMLDENKQHLVNAMSQDFKSAAEASLEVDSCIHNVRFALKNLKKWMQPIKKPSTLSFMLDSAFVEYAPKGIAFIIAPWNYPLALLIDPLIGAISAGNCCLLKASTKTPVTNSLLQELFSRYLCRDAYCLVSANVEACRQMLHSEDIDFVFFTGSYKAGQQIYLQAATRFIPVVLELGGKSPCVVTESAHFRSAVQRICWGKFFNSGQTCLAPDYVLVTNGAKTKGIFDEFVQIAHKYDETYFSDASNCSRIVSSEQFDRLREMFDEVPKEWILYEGKDNVETLVFGPKIVNVPSDVFLSNGHLQFRILTEEIFGPVLPIVEVQDANDAIRVIRFIGANPLALYPFTENPTEIRQITESISSGSVCINDVFMQVMNCELPFGGVGKSGMGKYHGRYSFEAFSHCRSMLHRTVRDETVHEKLRYPPEFFKRHKLLSRLLFF